MKLLTCFFLLLLVCSSAWAQTPGDSVLADYGLGATSVPARYAKGKRYFFYHQLAAKPVTHQEVDIAGAKLVLQKDVLLQDTLGYEQRVQDLAPLLPLRLHRYDYRNFESRIAAEDGMLRIPASLVEFAGARYNLDSLYWGDDYEDNDELKVTPVSAYRISLRENEWAALYVAYFSGSSRTNYYKILLFDLKKPGPPVLTPAYQAGASVWCFGDFDNDARLNYAQWNLHENDTLTPYVFDGRVFQKMDGYQLVLKPNDKPTDEMTALFYIVDRKRSRWFFEW